MPPTSRSASRRSNPSTPAAGSHDRRRSFARGLGLWLGLWLGLGLAATAGVWTPALAATTEPGLADGAERLREAALHSDDAYSLLADLCDLHGNRLSGSERLENAIAWMAERMRAMGLENVRAEAVAVPTWVRGHESLALVEPSRQRMAMLGLGGSVGTGGEPLRAPVVRVTSFEELDALADEAIRGRAVLFDVPYRGYGQTVRYRVSGASAAAARGAVAALVRSVGLDGLRTAHTGALHYDEAKPRIPAAAISVEDASQLARLIAGGRTPAIELRMEAKTLEDRTSHNLLAEVVGRERPEEIVVIGGHIDSWDVGQGAQDDGVGCVLAVEAAHLMESLGLRPRRTLRVVLWTNEENGLRGARTYAQEHAAELPDHVAAVESDSGNGAVLGFRFDLRTAALGAQASGDDAEARLEAVREQGRQRLTRWLTPLAQTGADSVFIAGSGADVGPLAEAGVPAIGLHHDTTEYFRIHHTEADTFDRIDPDDLRANLAAMVVLAWTLAEAEGTLRP